MYLWKQNWKPKGSQSLWHQSFSFTQRDKPRGQRRESWWTSMFLEEQSHFPSAEQTSKRQWQSAAMLCTTSRGNGGKWRLLVLDEVTKLFPEAAALWEPGSLQGLKLSSVPHLSSYAIPSSPLPLWLCKTLSLFTFSKFESLSQCLLFPLRFSQVSWQQRAVCAMFELQTCMWAPACQEPANGLTPLVLSLRETLLCPADGSCWPCGHSWWDPPHPTCSVESPTVVAAQASITFKEMESTELRMQFIAHQGKT